MNQRILEELAHQHLIDLQGRTADRNRGPRASAVDLRGQRAAAATARTLQSSLRERTGWTLVDLGLKLAAGSRAGRVRQSPPDRILTRFALRTGSADGLARQPATRR